jgi:hypothetical protein
MASGFGFPMLSTAKIAKGLVHPIQGLHARQPPPRPTPRHVFEFLGALINFLFYREGKLYLLKPQGRPRARLLPDYHEHALELKRQYRPGLLLCPELPQPFCSAKCQYPHLDS